MSEHTIDGTGNELLPAAMVPAEPWTERRARRGYDGTVVMEIDHGDTLETSHTADGGIEVISPMVNARIHRDSGGPVNMIVRRG